MKSFKINIPPSKSITHRALICAALARGKSILKNPLVCDDTIATCNVLEKLGIRIERLYSNKLDSGFRRNDNCNGWIVHGGTFKTPTEILDCNESGTTWRFLTAFTDCLQISCTLSGSPQLLRRGQKPDPQISSQYLSGLLLAAPCSKKKQSFHLEKPPVSSPYIALTIDVQKKFGVTIQSDKNFSEFEIAPQKYQPTDFEIEGDWSSAAFFIAAGLLSKPLALANLNPNSLQADRVIVDIAKEMGGKLEWHGNNLKIFPSKLRALSWDFAQSPDLYPVVSVLCACAEGKSRLTGIENLKFKESNRIEAMEKLLANPGHVESRDHRIVMAAAVLGLARKKPPTILHPSAVSKSFPEFWETFSRVM